MDKTVRINKSDSTWKIKNTQPGGGQEELIWKPMRALNEMRRKQTEMKEMAGIAVLCGRHSRAKPVGPPPRLKITNLLAVPPTAIWDKMAPWLFPKGFSKGGGNVGQDLLTPQLCWSDSSENREKVQVSLCSVLTDGRDCHLFTPLTCSPSCSGPD